MSAKQPLACSHAAQMMLIRFLYALHTAWLASSIYWQLTERDPNVATANNDSCIKPAPCRHGMIATFKAVQKISAHQPEPCPG